MDTTATTTSMNTSEHIGNNDSEVSSGNSVPTDNSASHEQDIETQDQNGVDSTEQAQQVPEATDTIVKDESSREQTTTDNVEPATNDGSQNGTGDSAQVGHSGHVNDDDHDDDINNNDDKEGNEEVGFNDNYTRSAVPTDGRQRRSYDTADSEDDNDEEALDAKIKQMNVPSNDVPGPEGRPLTERQLLEEKLDRLLKKPKVRRSRKDEDDLEQYMDEQILRLKDEMNIAAQMDIDTINKRIETGDKSLIAIQKVKLLPKVESVLSKANLADTILDNNLLQSVRIWLEPLPDGSLPSFEIQKVLFTAINNLPIKTEHLKESGLGRTMIFYTKSKRVEPQLARLAEKLIAEWTRPIIGASDNYRDKRIMQLEFDYEKLKRKGALDSALSHRKKKRQKQQSGDGDGTEGNGDNDETSHMTLYEQAAARRGRAAAPSQTTTDYKYAPVSNVTALRTNSRSSGVGSSLNNSELYKRLSNSLHKNKRR